MKTTWFRSHSQLGVIEPPPARERGHISILIEADGMDPVRYEFPNAVCDVVGRTISAPEDPSRSPRAIVRGPYAMTFDLHVHALPEQKMPGTLVTVHTKP